MRRRTTEKVSAQEKTKSDIAYETMNENCAAKISECEFFIESHILFLSDVYSRSDDTAVVSPGTNVYRKISVLARRCVSMLDDVFVNLPITPAYLAVSSRGKDNSK